MKAHQAADGRAWIGYTVRFCPVCGQRVGTHREPVDDYRRELVVYHQHNDTNTTAPARCLMADRRAAIAAVAFTGADTAAPGIPRAGRPYPARRWAA